MRILFDDVFFQLGKGGIARVWLEVLGYWAAERKNFPHDLIILNRSDYLTGLGFPCIDFQEYQERYAAQDSEDIGEVCRAERIDIFVSSYTTSTTAVPNLFLLHDCIPEKFGFSLISRGWIERIIAIEGASRIVTVSGSARNDLLHYFPHLKPECVSESKNGVDMARFVRAEPSRVSRLRKQLGLVGDYVVYVGSRSQVKSYKNGSVLFNLAAELKEKRISVLFVGGEKVSEKEREVASLHKNLYFADLSDDELAIAYSGALSLVMPSFYEGFGLPVLEAMSCGCPVVASSIPVVEEIGGEFILTVDPRNPQDVLDKILLTREEFIRDYYLEHARDHCLNYPWSKLAEDLAAAAQAMASPGPQLSSWQSFVAAKIAEIRAIQVDTQV